MAEINDRLTYFSHLAAYSSWANSTLLDSCAQLSDSEYFASRDSFFGSIHLTLNHLAVANLIWLYRLGARDKSYGRLDAEIHKDLKSLRTEIEETDDSFKQYIKSIDDNVLDGKIEYQLISRPNDRGQSLLPIALGHVFNHQTHHRGQVHGMLSQTDVSPPPLDLIYFPGT